MVMRCPRRQGVPCHDKTQQPRRRGRRPRATRWCPPWQQSRTVRVWVGGEITRQSNWHALPWWHYWHRPTTEHTNYKTGLMQATRAPAKHWSGMPRATTGLRRFSPTLAPDLPHSREMTPHQVQEHSTPPIGKRKDRLTNKWCHALAKAATNNIAANISTIRPRPTIQRTRN